MPKWVIGQTSSTSTGNIVVTLPKQEKMIVSLKGGKGSGHKGHAGRPGFVGGSLPGVGDGGRVAGQPISDWESDSNISDEKLSGHLSEGVANNADEWPWKEEGYEPWELPKAGEPERIKREIVADVVASSDDVLKERGLPETNPEEVSLILRQWAQTSNGSDMRSLSLQEATAEEFDLKMSKWQKSSLDAMRKDIRAQTPPGSSPESWALEHMDSSYSPLISRTRERAILRGMYDNTQSKLRDAGYKPGDTVKLFRGMKHDQPIGSKGDNVPYRGNAMESWSVGYRPASAFAMPKSESRPHGAVLGIEIPVENVLGTARTGFGCLSEGEFVIFGNIPGTEVSVLDVSVLEEG